jgi:hypothetical protein
LLAAPGPFRQATHRITHPGTTFEREAPYALAVSPGDTRLIIGGDLTVLVSLTGDAPEEAPLLETIVDGELRSRFVNLSADSSGTYQHDWTNIRYPFRYRVSTPLVTTPWYEVSLIERPLVQQLNVRLAYPTYSRIPAQALEVNTGDVSALQGTRAEITASLSGAATTTASLIFDSGRSVSMELNGRTASGTFAVQGDDSYGIQLRWSPRRLLWISAPKWLFLFWSTSRTTSAFLG